MSRAMNSLVTTSHPSWGAWIEIDHGAELRVSPKSHSSWDAWIEITVLGSTRQRVKGRTPHGVRGLKSRRVRFRQQDRVAPLMGCVD